jgi:hypothetical protein
VASFWFVEFGLRGILDHKTLAGVGFYGVVVWLGECTLGRFGGSKGVVMEVAEQRWRVGMDRW